MATLKEMADRVLNRSKTAGLTDRVEVTALLNEVAIEMCAELYLNEQVSTPTITGGPRFSIATDLLLTNPLAIRRILAPDNRPLHRVTVDAFETRSSNFLLGEYLYATDGVDSIWIMPGFSPLTTGQLLSVLWVPTPTLMTAPATVYTDIPVQFHDVLCWGAAARQVAKVVPALADTYEQRYENGKMKIRRWRNRSRGSFPVTITPSGRGSMVVEPGRDIRNW